MRVVNWNIEWMNNWFVGGDAVEFRPDHPSQGITDTDDLCTRVASVIGELDPEVVTIQEGPSDVREMELFVERYLSDNAGNPRFRVLGGLDGGSQKIYALVRDAEYADARLAQDPHTLELGDAWEADIDGDLELAPYEFTRLPLVIEGTTAGDELLRIVVLHTKSKFVRNGEAMWHDPDRRLEFVRAALVNRRRISTEAMRCRRLFDDFLAQEPMARVLVTGDFNDGPGVDYFESRYLTHNVTDILLGSVYHSDRIFRHSFFDRVPAQDRYTAIFDDFVDEIPSRRLLLDHVLASPGLATEIQDAGIAHAEFEDEIDPDASGRQQRPSDHRPVFVDL